MTVSEREGGGLTMDWINEVAACWSLLQRQVRQRRPTEVEQTRKIFDL